MKKCKKCNIIKHLEGFSKRKDSADGYRNHCKLCIKKYQKRYHTVLKYLPKEPIPPEGYKKCGACKQILKISNFGKNSGSKDGLKCYCKPCKNAKNREHNRKNKAYYAEYRRKNKDRIKAQGIIYRKLNKEKIKAKKREYVIRNYDKVKARRQRWYKKNKTALIVRKRQRRNSNMQLRLAENLRSRLNKVIRGRIKNGSAVKDLGCSIEELQKYLESKFYPHPYTGRMMSWENYGFKGWHIDHIMPLSSFDLSDRRQLKKACHYSNLQPLWAEENFIKNDKVG